MTTYEKRQTVKPLYDTFSHEKYMPYGYYCIDSEFIPSYVTEIKSFNEDELYIQKEKEFILTTIGAPTKN